MIETLIASSALILAIFLLRPLLRRRVSPTALYALWALVAVRLIVPWFYPLVELFGLVKSRLSVMNAVGVFQREVIEGSVMEPLMDNLATGHVYRYDQPAHIAERAAGIDWQLWIVGIWILGSFLLAIWMVVVNIRFMRRLQAERRPYRRPLPGFVTKRVYVVAELSSPCYFGLGSDEGIYLPERILEDEKAVLHALAHESCHVTHGDRFWGILRCVILCYYWVNPLVWLGGVWSRRDCELACDEAAVKLLGEEERYAYGRTLVGLIEQRSGGKGLLLASTTMTAGKCTIKDRIQTLARHPQTTASMAVVLAGVVVVLGACTFTEKVETEPQTEHQTQESPAESAGILQTSGEAEEGNDRLVMLEDRQRGNYYEIVLQRQDGESGDPKWFFAEGPRENQVVKVTAYQDAEGTMLSGDGNPDRGYGYALNMADGGRMILNIWNEEGAGSFRIAVTDQDTVLEYLYVAHDPEPLSAYTLTSQVKQVQGMHDTSVWLKSMTEYQGALGIVLEGETEEEANQFLNENEVFLRPIGAESPEAYVGVSQGSREGKEIHLLYLFSDDIPPRSQVMSIVAGSEAAEDGYVETLLDEYQISETARQFVAAYMSGDTETAARYSDLPDRNQRHTIEEASPGTGMLTIRWDPMDKETYAWSTYRFHETGQEDSYTYLELTLKRVLGEWVVVEAWFEK